MGAAGPDLTRKQSSPKMAGTAHNSTRRDVGMALWGDRNPAISLRRGTALLLLCSVLFLAVASDKFHNHPGADSESSSRLLSPPQPSLILKGESGGHTRPLVCIACLHHRTYGLGPFAGMLQGRPVVIPDATLGEVPFPPPAPLSRPTGLRAPPTA